MNEITVEKQIQVMNALLDDRIDCFGVYNTIDYLLDMGCTKEEVKALGFTEEDIFTAYALNLDDEWED